MAILAWGPPTNLSSEAVVKCPGNRIWLFSDTSLDRPKPILDHKQPKVFFRSSITACSAAFQCAPPTVRHAATRNPHYSDHFSIRRKALRALTGQITAYTSLQSPRDGTESLRIIGKSAYNHQKTVRNKCEFFFCDPLPSRLFHQQAQLRSLQTER